MEGTRVLAFTFTSSPAPLLILNTIISHTANTVWMEGWMDGWIDGDREDRVKQVKSGQFVLLSTIG